LWNKQYDSVVPYNHQGSETLVFINQALGVFVASYKHSKKNQNDSLCRWWIDYFYPRIGLYYEGNGRKPF